MVRVHGSNLAPLSSDLLLCRIGKMGNDGDDDDGDEVTTEATFIAASTILCIAPVAQSPTTVGVAASIDGGGSWSNDVKFTYFDAEQPQARALLVLLRCWSCLAVAAHSASLSSRRPSPHTRRPRVPSAPSAPSTWTRRTSRRYVDWAARSRRKALQARSREIRAETRAR